MKAIESFSEIKKGGQLVLISNPLFGEDICIFTSKFKDEKYPITSDGKKMRSLGRDNEQKKIIFISAEDEGCTGNEKIFHYCFVSSFSGSYEFKETDDPKAYNIRLIEPNDPEYKKDKNLLKFGKVFSKFFNKGIKDLEKNWE